ncbi:MAG: cytochrome c [Acidimicrobiales bacterium]
MRSTEMAVLTGRVRSLVVGVTATLLIAGCAAATTPEVTNGDPVLEQGRELYIRQCSSCHGSDGGGGRGTKLNDGAVLAAYPDIADQLVVVSEGRNAMPAFGGRFDDAELDAVVRYTREVLAESGGSDG